MFAVSFNAVLKYYWVLFKIESTAPNFFFFNFVLNAYGWMISLCSWNIYCSSSYTVSGYELELLNVVLTDGM